jgi:hypothetical protein
MDAFTPRNAAKYVVQAVVASKASKLAEGAITDYTRFEEDDTVVNISGHLVGWYVSGKLKPITDSMVDKTADYIVAKRAEMKSKKETSEEK